MRWKITENSFKKYNSILIPEQKSIKIINPLIKLANVLAIYPPYDFERPNNSTSFLFKLYATTIGTLIFILALISGYKRSINSDETNAYTFINVAYQLLQLFINMFFVFGAALWNRYNLIKVLHTFIRVDNQFNSLTFKRGIETDRSYGIIALIIIHVIYSLMLIHDILSFDDQNGVIYFRYFIVDYIQFYSIAIYILIVSNIVLYANTKFKALNNYLLQLGEYFEIKVTPNPENIITNLQKVPTRSFLVLYEAVCMINTTFGWSSLLFTLLVSLGLLYASALALVYGNICVNFITAAILWNICILVSPHFFSVHEG